MSEDAHVKTGEGLKEERVHRRTANLKPMSTRTREEAAELGRRGGIRSGEVRREKRKTLDLLELALKTRVRYGNGSITREEAYVRSVIRNATKKGSTDLMRLLAELRGEMVTKSEVDLNVAAPTVLTDEIVDDAVDTTVIPERAIESEDEEEVEAVVVPEISVDPEPIPVVMEAEPEEKVEVVEKPKRHRGRPMKRARKKRQKD